MKGNIDKMEESIEGRNGDRQRMALDMIDAIRSAEDAAAEIRKRAQDSSREILQKARENGETLVRTRKFLRVVTRHKKKRRQEKAKR